MSLHLDPRDDWADDQLFHALAGPEIDRGAVWAWVEASPMRAATPCLRSVVLARRFSAAWVSGLFRRRLYVSAVSPEPGDLGLFCISLFHRPSEDAELSVGTIPLPPDVSVSSVRFERPRFEIRYRSSSRPDAYLALSDVKLFRLTWDVAVGGHTEGQLRSLFARCLAESPGAT